MSKIIDGPELPSQAKLDEHARELGLIKYYSRYELMRVREEVRKIQKEDPFVKKIHRQDKKVKLHNLSLHEYSSEDMRHSVIFADNGRAYIVHKVYRADDKSAPLRDEHGKEIHYVGKGGFGEFRILQDVETGDFLEGVKIQEKRETTKKADTTPDEEQIERHLGMTVATLVRERPDKPTKLYSIKRRMLGKTIHEQMKSKEIFEGDKPYIALATLFEVAILHQMGICHRDLKELNIMCHKVKTSHAWMATVIDYGLSREVDRSLSGFGTIKLPREGTSGYADEAMFGDVKRDTAFKADSYSLARTLFNLFTSQGKKDPERIKLKKKGWGFDKKAAKAEMLRLKKEKELKIVRGLAASELEKRFTTKKAFVEMAKLYPKEAHEYLSIKLKEECQSIPDVVDRKNVPEYLYGNSSIIQSVNELKKWKPEGKAGSIEEECDNYFLLYTKASLLSSYIKNLKKYEEAFRLFNLEDSYKGSVLAVAALKKSESSDFKLEVIYINHFNMIDIGFLTQNFTKEFLLLPKSEYKDNFRADVQSVIDEFLARKLGFEEAKLKIDKIVEEMKLLSELQPTTALHASEEDSFLEQRSLLTTQFEPSPRNDKQEMLALVDRLISNQENLDRIKKKPEFSFFEKRRAKEQPKQAIKADIARLTELLKIRKEDTAEIKDLKERLKPLLKGGELKSWMEIREQLQALSAAPVVPGKPTTKP